MVNGFHWTDDPIFTKLEHPVIEKRGGKQMMIKWLGNGQVLIDGYITQDIDAFHQFSREEDQRQTMQRRCYNNE